MWQDDDFDTIGLDPHCLPLDVAPEEEVLRRTARVFHAWIEDWEDKDVGPQGYPVIEQHIFCKYGGLKWIDPDHEKLYIVHLDKTAFQNKQSGGGKFL